PVGIEDPHNPRIQPVKAMVRHGDRLCETFGFVIDAARAYRIDIAPIVLALRPYQWITVNFRSRCEEKNRAFGLGQAERVMSAQGANLQSRNRQFEIVHRTRGRSEMQDIVERLGHFDIAADIMIDKTKPGVFEKSPDIG